MSGNRLQLFAAACPLPYGVDEFSLAGFLRGEPVKLVRGKTISLEVPADAELILEGYVEKGEMRLEANVSVSRTVLKDGLSKDGPLGMGRLVN